MGPATGVRLCKSSSFLTSTLQLSTDRELKQVKIICAEEFRKGGGACLLILIPEMAYSRGKHTMQGHEGHYCYKGRTAHMTTFEEKFISILMKPFITSYRFTEY